MIDFYTWSTPNGRKVALMLEECGLAHTTHKIDIGKGEQFAPAFLAVNPNGKIPAIVDHSAADGKPLAVFESGAILIYLAEKTGKFLPTEMRARMEVLQWLMFQMGGVGPMFGQAHHFIRFAPEKVPYGIERYSKETRRLYAVMDKRLGESAYLAGADYSIADMATFPWVARHTYHEVDLADFPNVKRWHDAIAARPATIKAMAY
jgi:GSH-dependent disulfide-bond oxidoreductase